ncbi:MAG TPA: hypothetical protein DCP75_08180 [Haliea salexigens]|uniref:Uncharacterized protein n=1 Tax=Haliea salexigens TaxID=287487 RepID=A0A3C1KMJ1_9GAMM|nr:hypothetical protein [Haliea sp.]HAN27683.1 hypothetical protein [Haliea salexigens]|tara:strand:- start:3721 stop:3903 length:183 start_codon:yes stop_codon:yes gene_type:complete
MDDTSELDDFRTALAILHGFALESPTLNQRGIVRMLERLINVAAQLSTDELERNANEPSV